MSYRKQIDFYARQEFSALTEASSRASRPAENRKQLERVRQFGGPPLVEHWTREMNRTAREAAAGRRQAAEHGRKRRELEEAYYRLWESVPPELWESTHISPSCIP